jgi:hypothetical protein
MQARLVLKGAALLLLLASCLLGNACGSSSGGPSTPTNTGQSCSVAADCYPGLDGASVHGDIECLTRVPSGYCTHACATDADCCAVPGECPDALAEVCAPFESTGEMLCFLSCEDAPVTASGFTDSDAFCQRYANAAFICRSSGGGSKNRKVCVPSG